MQIYSFTIQQLWVQNNTDALKAAQNAIQIAPQTFLIPNRNRKCYQPLIARVNVKCRLHRCNHRPLTLQHRHEKPFCCARHIWMSSAVHVTGAPSSMHCPPDTTSSFSGGLLSPPVQQVSAPVTKYCIFSFSFTCCHSQANRFFCSSFTSIQPCVELLFLFRMCQPVVGTSTSAVDIQTFDIHRIYGVSARITWTAGESWQRSKADMMKIDN